MKRTVGWSQVEARPPGAQRVALPFPGRAAPFRWLWAWKSLMVRYLVSGPCCGMLRISPEDSESMWHDAVAAVMPVATA